jgi:hypothetical protein
MTGGYVVADAPNGLGTAAHPGTGQPAAAAWLDRLRGLAALGLDKVAMTGSLRGVSEGDAAESKRLIETEVLGAARG